MNQTNPDLSFSYWNKRYEDSATGWDIGYASPALVEFVLSSVTKDKCILIPGSGRGYEAEILYKAGYSNVIAIDFAERAKEEFLKRVPDFPEDQYLVLDFFAIDQKFDLVLEQTFFCALDPELRMNYVRKIHAILKEGGLLAGVLFDMDNPEGPPFGGRPDEYTELFKGYFEILKMEACYNSIDPRKGTELFIKLKKI